MADDNYESAIKRDSADDVAQFEDDHGRGIVGRIHHALHTNPALVPLIVLVAAIAGFGLVIGARFFPQLFLVLQQVQIVGVLAMAQALIILTAGIDLSVGAIAVLSSVVMGRLTFFGFAILVPGFPGGEFGWMVLAEVPPLPPALAVFVSLAVGTGIGAVSGYLVSRVKLPPFITTLGMWQIVLAANYLYSKNETIRSRDLREEAPLLRWLGLNPNEQFVSWIERTRGIVYERRRPDDTDQFLLDIIWQAKITYGVVLFLVIALVLAYCLRSTAWGRHVYAVGDDPEAAQLAGVNVHRTLMSVYMVAGFICALAGWVLIGRLGSVSPSASTGVVGNIESITAVVIGGISLFGGRGSIWGAFFGALIVGVFDLGLGMQGVNTQWTYLIIGFLIIGAVTVDQWIRKVSS